ncbi:amidase signature domain-containing protein [Thamnocephalis sphaerospora]|uniref:amidase n=1 Tax=Thamnocephalis sphaerospora TaxID=78915 RepID=A0A4P9XLC8_9FUNG|nr:amidase signature domain-containing protein [Thamnocephalis sphaerospora]RKP06615.1 amidase signature domain-containing protein [Thamnocephalis sphaerospora]|eukprot:RKP06225.1 amidase signature domain-containing protein [Thamnocephalis sphaerospora]
MLDDKNNEPQLLEDATELINIPLEETAKRLASKRYSADWVLSVLGRNTIQAQEKCNCLTDLFLDEAFARAKELDAMEQPLGPLHGIPVSIKDNIDVRGRDTTMGVSGGIGKPLAEDAPIVQLLRSAGAIVFAKTNLPQAMGAVYATNHIFGATSTPHNPALSAGGSSGGEGALIAAGGSILGVGNDIAGSVRIPAQFNGIYSLKPTDDRLPALGNHMPSDGVELLRTTCGPMARDVGALELFMRAIIDQEPWRIDPNCVPVPWKRVSAPKQMRIAYYVDLDNVALAPVCRRAMTETLDALRAAGHELVEFRVPDIEEAVHIACIALTFDGDNQIGQVLGDDQPLDWVKHAQSYSKTGPLKRSFLAWMLEHHHKEPAIARLVRALKTKTHAEICDITVRRNLYRQRFFAELDRQTTSADGRQVDVILSPALHLPAVEHTAKTIIPFDFSCTLLYNVLEAPAGHIPVTKLDRTLDAQHDGVSWYGDGREIRIVEQELRQLYKPDLMHGSPAGIQVAGRRFEDERVLACMRTIDTCVREYQKSSCRST